MTIHRNLNKAGWGGNYTIFWLVKAMLSAGWTVRNSGSGTGGTYEASGNVFDMSTCYNGGSVPAVGGASGSEPFGSEGMWLVLVDPDGNRDILFRRHKGAGNSYDDCWVVAYSRSAGFTGGSPDVDDPGTATDEQVVSVTGTIAIPNPTHAAGNVATIVHACADDVAGEAGVYGFFACEMKNPNATQTVLVCDDLRQVATGDPEGCVFVHGRRATQTHLLSSSSVKCWVDVGGAGEAWLTGAYKGFSGLGGWYHSVGFNSRYDGYERAIRLLACDDSVGGYLGRSRWFAHPGVPRGYPNTANAETYLYLDDMVVSDLLDGGTTPNAI